MTLDFRPRGQCVQGHGCRESEFRLARRISMLQHLRRYTVFVDIRRKRVLSELRFKAERYFGVSGAGELLGAASPNQAVFSVYCIPLPCFCMKWVALVTYRMFFSFYRGDNL